LITEKMEAYIVSAVRTAVGRAKKGTLRNTRPEFMGAEVVKEAIARVKGLKPEMVEDVLIGCAFPEGAQGMNMGRIIAQKAGLPDSVAGATVNRFCSSGLQTIAMAAQAIKAGDNQVIVAGGSESMSAVPMGGFFYAPDPDMVHDLPDTYVDMGNTAENLAAEYGISRADQDAFSLASHQKAVDAIQSGRFADEILPLSFDEMVYVNGKRESKHFDFVNDEGRRQFVANVGWRCCHSGDEPENGGRIGHSTDGANGRLCGGRRSCWRDGHWPCSCNPQSVATNRLDLRRY
jgi:acetyl-CoA acyltransferase